MPMKQPKKGRLWLNHGSCVRLRPEYRDHVCSYDFAHHQTDDGRAVRTLNIQDEHSRECLVIRVKRKLSSTKVIDARTDLFILRSVPAYISSLSHRGVSTRSKHGLGRLFGQRPSLPSQTQSRLLRLSPALRRDHRVANPEGLNSIYEVSCLPLRPLQRKVLLLPITPQRRGRSGSPCLMIP